MSIDAIAQVVTVLVGVLGIIWHQQRSTEKLHDKFDKLRDVVVDNGQRLARIEGFLGIGMPAAAGPAAGAAATPATPATDPQADTPPAPTGDC